MLNTLVQRRPTFDQITKDLNSMYQALRKKPLESSSSAPLAVSSRTGSVKAVNPQDAPLPNMRIRSATAYLPGTDPRSLALQARAAQAESALSDVASVAPSQAVTQGDAEAGNSAVPSPFQEAAAPGPSASELQVAHTQQSMQPYSDPLVSSHGQAVGTSAPLNTDDTGQREHVIGRS